MVLGVFCPRTLHHLTKESTSCSKSFLRGALLAVWASVLFVLAFLILLLGNLSFKLSLHRRHRGTVSLLGHAARIMGSFLFLLAVGNAKFQAVTATRRDSLSSPQVSPACAPNVLLNLNNSKLH